MSLDFALEDDFPFSADAPEPEAAEVVVDEDSFAVGEVVCCVWPPVDDAPPPPPAEPERW